MLTIGEQNAAGLVQIRKSPTHKTDLNVLDEYAGLFPQGTARYIVLVPDMETSDKFRLSLADPPTQVLYRSMERISGSDACLSQVFVTVRCGTGPRIVGY
ncbi:hypothetical protein JG688_00006062 [Phytophthora aleatoria]|uniref:Uncharacterized protein n=1 Tax=Phytophthora aleatoria TaxID=2496075 RepID=A0A8J5JC62_9STRA|nr:hypothetical protein JG688_00006062 [Phytophthora aleatoria]